MKLFATFFSVLRAIVPIVATTTAQCTADTFNDVSLFGGQVLRVEANPIINLSAELPLVLNAYPTNVTSLNVCQVTVLYTHPGQNDAINVTVWLPSEGWNGRYMAVGGGGFAAQSGLFSLMQPASLGFAASMTDAGHDPDNGLSAPWGLVSPGNVNWALLFDFTRIAYNDMGIISKSIIASYYGSRPRFSYWNGCSTGGRQGYQMAQSYPTQYDGILATAPAINWGQFLVSEYWPQSTMDFIDYYPKPCEMVAIAAAATEACDELDGAKDGIIALPGLCNFDPKSVIGQTFDLCDIPISAGAAEVASALWTGPSTVDGKFLWYGLNKDADPLGLANTTCSDNGTCTINPFGITDSWIKTFVLKDNTTSLRNLTHAQYDRIFRASVDQYTSIISANNPDLTDFRNNGGKMITWHGLADQLIPPNGTYDYYDRVLEHDANAADYYRVFAAPGIGHCAGGPGWFPGDAIQSLVNWVENGVAPDTLEAKSIFSPSGIRTANLCAYPKQLVYIGGDASQASSFTCQ